MNRRSIDNSWAWRVGLATAASSLNEVGAEKWPVVRRDAEFLAIEGAIAGTTDTPGIILVGDAGVGKTTLARLVTKSLPTRVQWVAGTESARSIPL